MKLKTLFFALIVTFVASCSNEPDGFLSDSSASVQTTEQYTRAGLSDTTDVGELVPFKPTDEMLIWKQRLKENRAYSISYMNDEDEFFSDNIFAISEYGIYIKVKNNGEQYFSCAKANDEVTLSNTANRRNGMFYLKVLPAISGIPYLIYSYASKTPLCIGEYKKTGEKILMTANDDNIDKFLCGWDLKPANNKGYFYIQSIWYSGLADPNDFWSSFKYVLEARSDNKIRYAKMIDNKVQQEFSIKSIMTFQADSIIYDLKNATLTKSTPIEENITYENFEEESYNYKLSVDLGKYNETSFYRETKGLLDLDIVPGNKLFQRPTPSANTVILLTGGKQDALYDTKVSRNIKCDKGTYVTSITVPAKSLMQLKVKFITYRIKVPYVMVAKYESQFAGSTTNPHQDIRKVKVKGVWEGYVIANPNGIRPIIEPHFTDLETGGEIVP